MLAQAPLLFYGALALVVLGESLQPGYVLTLDMVFGPEIKLEDWFYGLDTPFSAALPFMAIQKGLSLLLPVWLIQKLLLFLVLFLSGLSSHRLCPSNSQAGRYFAGLIYMLNPFVYVRFLAGSLTLLLAYAITPFLVATALAFFERPAFRGAMALALWTMAVAVVDLRGLVLVLLLVGVLFLVRIFHRLKSPRYALNLAGFSALAAVAFLLMSLYWLPGALEAETSILGDISQEDLLVFTARNWGTGLNVMFSLTTLHGFWRGGYQYIGALIPWWPVIFAFVLFLVVHGVVSNWRNPLLGGPVVGMALAAVLALALSTGISTPYFSPYFEFLFEKLVILRGLRDSQKFVAILALAYSYLGGLGLAALLGQYKWGEMGPRFVYRGAALGLCATSLVSPVLLAMNMLWGFNGQLRAADYPQGWYEARSFLSRDTSEYRTLFFPWHLYMDLSWTGNRTSNPSPYFFPSSVIAGENAEVGPIAGQSLRPVQSYIEYLLARKARIEHLGEFLIPLNVKYVLLAKEVDFWNYDFLYRQQDLRVVLENDKLVLWENLKYRGPLVSLEALPENDDWNALFDSIERPPGLKEPASPSGRASSRASFQRLSPVSYRVETSSAAIVLFAAPYDRRWSLGGHPPSPAWRIANSYSAPQGDTMPLSFGGWPRALVFYGMSLLAFAFVAAVAAGCPLRKLWPFSRRTRPPQVAAL